MNNTVEYIESKGWQFKEQGKELILQECPFCRDTRSHFYIRRDNGLYFCQKCQTKGNLSQLKKHHGDVDTTIRQAFQKPKYNRPARDMAEKHHAALLRSSETLAYLEGRKIMGESIERFKLGLCQKNGTGYLSIPHYRGEELINIKFRALPPAEKEFKQVTGCESILFNTDAVDTLFIPDISYIATMDPVDDLTAVPFMDASFLDTLDLGAPTPPDLSGVPHLFDFLALPPGTSASFPVPTEGNWDGGSIVIRYGFLDTFLGGRDRALLWGRHTVDASTGIGETPPPGLPRLELLPNRPNPFNPATEIRYRLAEAGAVRLRLISPSGRELRVLAEGRRPAGVNLLNWDGRDGQGRALPSGVYLCVLEAGGEQVSRKLVLLE